MKIIEHHYRWWVVGVSGFVSAVEWKCWSTILAIKKRYYRILCGQFYMVSFLILADLDHWLYLMVENDFYLLPHRWVTYLVPHASIHHKIVKHKLKQVFFLPRKSASHFLHSSLNSQPIHQLRFFFFDSSLISFDSSANRFFSHFRQSEGSKFCQQYRRFRF
jgi:hypothetical protein